MMLDPALVVLAVAQVIVVALHLKPVIAMRRWPTTVGTVTRAWVDLEGKYFVPHVEFRYQVNGTTFTSDWFWAFTSHYDEGLKASAESEIVPYPAGTTVRVSYSPASPEQAVVIVNPAWTPVLFCLGVALFDVFGAMPGTLREQSPLVLYLFLAIFNSVALFGMVDVARRRRVQLGSD